jgi:predicted DNA-binding mobile mystery protein A
MTAQSSTARARLDQRLVSLGSLRAAPRPQRGWVRAIRDALGMSGTELARRMGVSQSTVAELEVSEADDRIQLGTLRRAADALDCDLVYVLLPRTSLEDAVQARARAKASRHLAVVGHHGRLEDQEVGEEVADAQVDRLARQLVDRRGLWSDDR